MGTRGSPYPATEKLTLDGYDWVHSRSEYIQLWDFSRLRSLHLARKFDKFIDEFAGVPRSELSKLEALKISRFWHRRIAPTDMVRASLSNFIGGLKNLKKFKLEYHIWAKLLSIEFLAPIAGNTLQTIQLRDARQARDGDEFDKSISICNLSLLHSYFPQLRHLGLDLVTKSSEVNTHRCPAISTSNH
jgi:hypothetical protein